MLKNKIIFLIGVLVFASFVLACCPEPSCPGDYDCDGVLDKEDNCKFVWNPLQEDCDDDERGNVCDPSPNCEEGPYCGDGFCIGNETCSTCSEDCGICPSICGNNILESGEECDDGNIVNGDGCSSECLIEEEDDEDDEDCKKCKSGGSSNELVFFCDPNWKCAGWSECDSGTMHRKCYDSNNCGVSYNKPIEKTGCDLMTNVLVAPTQEEGLSLTALFLISLLIIIVLLVLVNTL
jgi:cysteine-rich repeat protein